MMQSATSYNNQGNKGPEAETHCGKCHDNRSGTAARSAQSPVQRAQAESIDSSPLMVMQRQKLHSLFGGTAQRQESEEEPLQGRFAAVQRAVEEEEPLQGQFLAVQRVEGEGEEPVQGKFATVQRVEEEEPLQGKFTTVQRVEEEEPLQGRFAPVQRIEEEEPLQGKFASQATAQREEQPAKANDTGLPDNLKTGIESLSGISMDSVKVHYNSPQPTQLNALAYAQGNDIHVAPGQERHLPHEAWHVVQQAQGRVLPTTQLKDGVPVNDDEGLEHEADVMGEKATASDQPFREMVASQNGGENEAPHSETGQLVQRMQDFDFSYNDSSGDENDGHTSGFQFAMWPKFGELSDETKAKYEQKLVTGSERSNYYYGIPSLAEKQELSPLEKILKSSRHSIYDYKIKKPHKMARLISSSHKKYAGSRKHKINFSHEALLKLIQDTHQLRAATPRTQLPHFSGSDSPFQFVLKNLTLRSTGTMHPFDYTNGPNNNINFAANVAPGNYDPIDYTSHVDLETGCAVPKHGITLSGNVVKLAPNGSRPQHFSIADRLNPAAAAKRPGTWTWHHLDNEYKMILVDSAVHNPGFGGFWHWGGMAFWT